MFCSVKS